MSLFSTLVFSDGTDNHTFEARSPYQEGNSLCGDFVEPAADSSAGSKLVIKQDESKSTVRRRLLQRRILVVNVDGDMEPITVNFTINHSPKHSTASIVKEGMIAANAIATTGFLDAFVDGHVQ